MPQPPPHRKTEATAAAVSRAAGMSQWPVVAILRLLLMLQALPQLYQLLPGSLQVSAAALGREKTIYWNASNPLFKPSGDNVLYVNTLDRINFVCPNNDYEYYRVYWTTDREKYLACSGGTEMFDCPRMKSYLVIVQIFAADPTAPVFLTPVYFYTPSTGGLLGFNQTRGGACETRNLRITVRTDSAPTSNPDPAKTSTTSTSANKPSTPPTEVTSMSTSGSSSRADKPTIGQSTTTADGRAGTAAVTTGRKQPDRPGGDAEHPDYSRMSNLITGSAVAMPTLAAVAGLNCLSVLLLTTDLFA